MNFKQVKAIESAHKKQWVKHFGEIPDTSGIYILTRFDNGFKYAYIGQAKHILTRLAQHLSGYQHIDLSLKNHKLWSEDNKNGWKLEFYECEDLDFQEQLKIKEYANNGFQMRNKTAGGQNNGKFDIAENITKGYQQGVKNGYEKARKEIAHLFELHLTYQIKGKQTIPKQKAMKKFEEFLKGE